MKLALLEKGIPLSGIESQADLTPFQIRVIGLVEQRARDEAEEEYGQPEGGRMNRGAVSDAGGENRQITRVRNLSHETGKTPEQLIAEHKK
jgi:hypothetical protein